MVFCTGDRQPGESFAACVDRNIRETTFGTIDPQKLAKTLPAEAVGLAGVLAGKVPFNIPFDPEKRSPMECDTGRVRSSWLIPETS
jgi:hypothetical protein